MSGTGELVDGRAIARGIEADLRERVAGLGRVPVLGVLVAGGTEGTGIYLRQIEGAAGRLGVELRLYVTDPGGDPLATLDRAASETDGVLIDHPLPDGLSFEDLVLALPPERDVEGLNPCSLGRIVSGEPAVIPPTPAAVLEVVEHVGLDLRGTEAVIVNHTPILGRPLSVLLLRGDATVTVCHVHTRDLAAHTRRADLLVVGAGVPGLIGPEMVTPGAVVVDVGMNRVDGRVCGDVLTGEVLDVASRVTPVPGGIGPITVAMLMRNLIRLAGGSSRPAGTG